MPDEIGQDAKFENLKDMYSVRIREDFKITGSATDGTGAKKAATNRFLFNELTFYPITGAIGKYWSTESELTFNPGETTELENAYVRATYPVNKDFFLTARAGIFHPFEGFGASDRPISNFRPSFQRVQAANGTFKTHTNLWGQDQEGLEIGGTYKDTTLTLAILSGFNTTKIDGGGFAAANEGKENNLKDLLFFFNHMFGDKAAVSAEYLTGATGFCYGGLAPGDTGAPCAAAQWQNNYQRGELYANYKVMGDKLNVLAGSSLGKDHMPNPANTVDNSGSFNSWGWFGMVESKFTEYLTGASRYDVYKPSTRSGGNLISAVTFTAALPFEWAKFLVDYQIKRTQHSNAKDTTDNTLQAEWMIHF